jgi:hypothetical protein
MDAAAKMALLTQLDLVNISRAAARSISSLSSLVVLKLMDTFFGCLIIGSPFSAKKIEGPAAGAPQTALYS